MPSSATPEVTEEPKNKDNVLVRGKEGEKERWAAAAERRGVSMNEFVRLAVNAAASELLDCQHPRSARKAYPWSETCTACGHRFK